MLHSKKKKVELRKFETDKHKLPDGWLHGLKSMGASPRHYTRKLYQMHATVWLPGFYML